MGFVEADAVDGRSEASWVLELRGRPPCSRAWLTSALSSTDVGAGRSLPRPRSDWIHVSPPAELGFAMGWGSVMVFGAGSKGFSTAFAGRPISAHRSRGFHLLGCVGVPAVRSHRITLRGESLGCTNRCSTKQADSKSLCHPIEGRPTRPQALRPLSFQSYGARTRIFRRFFLVWS